MTARRVKDKGTAGMGVGGGKRVGDKGRRGRRGIGDKSSGGGPSFSVPAPFLFSGDSGLYTLFLW